MLTALLRARALSQRPRRLKPLGSRGAARPPPPQPFLRPRLPPARRSPDAAARPPPPQRFRASPGGAGAPRSVPLPPRPRPAAHLPGPLPLHGRQPASPRGAPPSPGRGRRKWSPGAPGLLPPRGAMGTVVRLPPGGRRHDGRRRANGGEREAAGGGLVRPPAGAFPSLGVQQHSDFVLRRQK